MRPWHGQQVHEKSLPQRVLQPWDRAHRVKEGSIVPTHLALPVGCLEAGVGAPSPALTMPIQLWVTIHCLYCGREQQHKQYHQAGSPADCPVIFFFLTTAAFSATAPTSMAVGWQRVNASLCASLRSAGPAPASSCPRLQLPLSPAAIGAMGTAAGPGALRPRA